jgi:hypothetical protein
VRKIGFEDHAGGAVPGAGLSVGLDEEADLAQLPVRLRGVEELEVVAIGLELPVVDRVEVDVGLAQELGLAQVEVGQVATNGLNASRTGAGGEDQGPMNKKHEVSLFPLRDPCMKMGTH